MKRPSRRKLGRFALLTFGYGFIASFVVLFMAIRTCSMHSDYAAACDPTPINITIGLIGLAYIALGFLFFRAELSGED